MRSTLLANSNARRRPPTIVSAPHYVESLLGQIVGYAAAAGTTGGAGSPSVRVTNLNASGTGSLVAALASSAYITFDPTLRGTITYTGFKSIPANTTIDGRGADITVDGPGLQIAGPNVIVTNLKLTAVATTNAGSDCLDVLPRVGADKIWVHRITASDSRDGLFDCSGYESTLCRVTASECHFGPNPGPAGIARGQKSGKGNLCGSVDASATDVYTAGLFTFYRCLWEGVEERNPLALSSCVHVYQSAVSKFGDLDGESYGMSSGRSTPRIEAELRVEGSVFRPYRVGESHVVPGTGTVNRPCICAIERSDPADDAARRIYENNNLFLYGAKAGRTYQLGTTSPITGRAMTTINPELNFKDPVFTPPYSYLAPRPADGESFIRELRASAGWHNVPPPF